MYYEQILGIIAAIIGIYALWLSLKAEHYSKDPIIKGYFWNSVMALIFLICFSIILLTEKLQPWKIEDYIYSIKYFFLILAFSIFIISASKYLHGMAGFHKEARKINRMLKRRKKDF